MPDKEQRNHAGRNETALYDIKQNDRHMLEQELTEQELDELLAQWAEAEVEVPEGFHSAVMERLQQEQAVVQHAMEPEPDKNRSKKGIVVSLSEKFSQKKAWVSVAAAAALVLCCMPILQNQQDNLAGSENMAAQTYDMRQSRVIAQNKVEDNNREDINMEDINKSVKQADNNNENSAAGNTEHQVMMTSLQGATDTVTADNEQRTEMAKRTTEPEKVMAAADKAEFAADTEQTIEEQTLEGQTIEEQLEQAQQKLMELEAQLEQLPEDETNKAQRVALLTEIDVLKIEIAALEEQLDQNKPAE